MADGTQLNPGSGGDLIASDVITTLNGSADGTGEKAQRVKVGYGADGVFNDVNSNQPLPVSLGEDSSLTFKGRAQTFRIPGRAGTTGQKLMTLFNASGSTKVVHINQVTIDIAATVVKAVTVLPPVIRVYRITALPTNGSSVTKVARDSSLTSSSSITILGDASADGTNSTTALTATLPAGNILTQEFAPRLITAAGYEMFDRTVFFGDTTITLRASEGIAVALDYTLATQNPTTDMWIAGIEWDEL